MAEQAAALGLTQPQLSGILKHLSENAGAPASGPTEEEIAGHRAAELDQLGPNGPRQVRAVSEWLAEKVKSGTFSPEISETIRMICSTADGVKAMNAIRAITSGPDIDVGSYVSDGLPSDAEIAEMMKSEAYRRGDPATSAKIKDLLLARSKAGRPEKLQF
jgi:hypothetical protein